MQKRLLSPKKKSFFLLGPRGTGKTTWLRQQFPHALFLDLLDETLFFQLQTDRGALAQILEHATQDWVIIDEFQRIPSLLNTVHRYIERGKKFALSGSSARKIRQAGVNLLAGRALDTHMHPFIPRELGANFQLERALQYGLIPSIYFEEAPYDTLSAYTKFYIQQEIQMEALVRNLPSFLRFLQIASLFHGQVVQFSTLARDAEIARSTAQGHMEILLDTLLGYLIPAFTPKLRVREKHSPKFYFFDCGIARTLKYGKGPLPPDAIGHLFEGLILQILLAYRDYFDLFDEIFYWAPSKSTLEVDFILKKGEDLVALEVKYTSRIRPEHLKGLKAIAELPNVQRRILVYVGTLSQRTEEGIEILTFSDFTEALDLGLFR